MQSQSGGDSHDNQASWASYSWLGMERCSGPTSNIPAVTKEEDISNTVAPATHVELGINESTAPGVLADAEKPNSAYLT